MNQTSILTSSGPQIPSLGFGWIGYLHLWLLLAAITISVSLIVMVGSIRISVTAPAVGRIVPRHLNAVRSPVRGIVSAVLVDEGDTVVAGETVARLRSDELRRQLDLVEASLATHTQREQIRRAEIRSQRRRLDAAVSVQRRRVALAGAELGRIKQIQALGSANIRAGWRRRPLPQLIPVRRAADALDLAKTELAAAIEEAQGNSARDAELDWLQAERHRLLWQRAHLFERLAEHSLRSDVSGVVRTVDPSRIEGAVVDDGQVLIEISTSDEWAADMSIVEDDWAKIHTGQRARLFLDAYPHINHGTLEATVESVSASSHGGPHAAYPLRLVLGHFDEDEVKVAEGMSVTAQIVVEERSVISLATRWMRRQFHHAGPLWARVRLPGGSE